jgi:hypothetical protein
MCDNLDALRPMAALSRYLFFYFRLAKERQMVIGINPPTRTPTLKKIVLDDQSSQTLSEHIDKIENYIPLIAFIISLISLAISWRNYLATHRPHIIIHSFDPYTDAGNIITYVNVGTRKAIIESISSYIFFSGNQNLCPLIKNSSPINKTIKPGEKTRFTIKSEITNREIIMEEDRRGRGQPNKELFCIGKISYSDSWFWALFWKSKRETGFYRKFDSTKNVWVKVDNADYEYSY